MKCLLAALLDLLVFPCALVVLVSFVRARPLWRTVSRLRLERKWWPIVPAYTAWERMRYDVELRFHVMRELGVLLADIVLLPLPLLVLLTHYRAAPFRACIGSSFKLNRHARAELIRALVLLALDLISLPAVLCVLLSTYRWKPVSESLRGWRDSLVRRAELRAADRKLREYSRRQEDLLPRLQRFVEKRSPTELSKMTAQLDELRETVKGAAQLETQLNTLLRTRWASDLDEQDEEDLERAVEATLSAGAAREGERTARGGDHTSNGPTATLAPALSHPFTSRRIQLRLALRMAKVAYDLSDRRAVAVPNLFHLQAWLQFWLLATDVLLLPLIVLLFATQYRWPTVRRSPIVPQDGTGSSIYNFGCAPQASVGGATVARGIRASQLVAFHGRVLLNTAVVLHDLLLVPFALTILLANPWRAHVAACAMCTHCKFACRRAPHETLDVIPQDFPASEGPEGAAGEVASRASTSTVHDGPDANEPTAAGWRTTVWREAMWLVIDFPFLVMALSVLCSLWRSDVVFRLLRKASTGAPWRRAVASQFVRLLLDVLVGLPLFLLVSLSLWRLPGFAIELRKRMHAPLSSPPRMRVRRLELRIPTRGRDGRPQLTLDGTWLGHSVSEMNPTTTGEPVDVAQAEIDSLRCWVLGDTFWAEAQAAVGGMLTSLARSMLPIQLPMGKSGNRIENIDSTSSLEEARPEITVTSSDAGSDEGASISVTLEFPANVRRANAIDSLAAFRGSPTLWLQVEAVRRDGAASVLAVLGMPTAQLAAALRSGGSVASLPLDWAAAEAPTAEASEFARSSAETSSTFDRARGGALDDASAEAVVAAQRAPVRDGFTVVAAMQAYLIGSDLVHLLLLCTLGMVPWRLLAALQLMFEPALAWPARLATGTLRNLKFAEHHAEVAHDRLHAFCAYRAKEHACCYSPANYSFSLSQTARTLQSRRNGRATFRNYIVSQSISPTLAAMRVDLALFDSLWASWAWQQVLVKQLEGVQGLEAMAEALVQLHRLHNSRASLRILKHVSDLFLIRDALSANEHATAEQEIQRSIVHVGTAQSETRARLRQLEAEARATCRKAVAQGGCGWCSKDLATMWGIVRLQAAQAVTDVLALCALLVLLVTAYRVPALLSDMRAAGSLLFIHTSTKLVLVIHLRALVRDIFTAGRLLLLLIGLLLTLVRFLDFLVLIPHATDLRDCCDKARDELRTAVSELWELAVL